MKIFSKLFGRKMHEIQQELPKPEQVKQTVAKVAEKVEQIGHEFNEAVKAKYFTRIATAKNGGTVTMTFDSKTNKLKSWTRQNPNGTITKGKINTSLSPMLRQSTIQDGDIITRKTTAQLGDATEINTQTINISKYPQINTKEKDMIFIKGKKQPVRVKELTETENMPKHLNISKEDYKNLI